MAKRPLSLHVRIPPYRHPRNEWRKEVHKAVQAKMRDSGISYRRTDRLQLSVKLYLPEPALLIQDVDNRLKDLLDALQGRAGGPKKVRAHPPLVPNDNQIYRVVMEKCVPNKNSGNRGHLTIRKLATPK